MEDFPGTATERRIGAHRGRVNVLLADHFDIIHKGHVEAIREAKESFDSVFLIAGILQDEFKSSLLTLEEKETTLMCIEGIDNVMVLGSEVTEDWLERQGIDFAASPDPGKFSHRTLQISVDCSRLSHELLARTISKSNKFKYDMMDKGYKVEVSGFSYCRYKLKKALKILAKKIVKQTEFAEEFVDQCRFQLQTAARRWSEKSEILLIKCIESPGNYLKRLYESLIDNC